MVNPLIPLLGSSSEYNPSQDSSHIYYDSSIADSGSSGSASTGGFCYDWVTIFGLKITDPFLVPLSLWALYIGVKGFKFFKQFTSAYMYALIFITYGIMMTSAMLADSFSEAPNFPVFWAKVFGLMDVTLTSTIGVLLFITGLVDLNIIDPKKNAKFSKVLYALIIFTLLTLWYICFFDGKEWDFYLYDCVVGTGGFTYLVCQFIYLEKKRSLGYIKWLFLAGISGAVGLGIVLEATKWCEIFGAHFSASYAWFFLSDVAMLFVRLYVTKSRQLNNNNNNSDNNLNNNNNIQYVVLPTHFDNQPIQPTNQPFIFYPMPQQQQQIVHPLQPLPLFQMPPLYYPQQQQQ